MSDNSTTVTGCAEIVDANLPALRALCRRFHVRRLDLFGSAATGRFDPARSDLDFLVEFGDLPPGAYAKAYFGLLEGLQALFQREIDLLTEPSIENPYLRRQIEAERRPLFPPP
jgi:predicted nucleotidyltransferase